MRTGSIHPISNVLHLLVAPPAGGKTRDCIHRARQAAQASPLAVVWVIVRDERQEKAFRRRLAYSGGALGVRVATFYDLYQEILALSGQSVLAAGDVVLSRVTRAAVDEVYEGGDLQFYAPIRTAPGFLQALRDRFGELKRSLVLPDRLLDEAARLGDPALLELARIYAVYQRRLVELGWADTDGLSWLAFEALELDPDLLRGWRLVLVDGFDSFNPTQRRTLAELTGRVNEVRVTLPGTAEMDRSAHRRFASTLRSLRETLGDRLVIEAPQGGRRAYLPAPLDRVEERLFEQAGAAEPDQAAHTPALTLIEARSPEEEAREALRWIKAAIVRDEMAISSCAVMVPDDAAYHAALRAAAAEFGVPLRFSQGDRLEETPPAAALRDLLALPLKDFPLRPLLDTIRSPYLDLSTVGLAGTDAALLELTARKFQIIEGRAAWVETLGWLAGQAEEETGPADSLTAFSGEEPLSEPDEDESGSVPAPRLPHGRTAARLLEGLRGLWALLDSEDAEQGRRSLTRWTEWLNGILAALRFYELPEPAPSEEERGWQSAIQRLLHRLAESESLTGPRPYTYAAFLSELEGLLNGERCRDLSAGNAAAVTVYHIYEARGLRFKAAALLGLSEGGFPTVVRPDPLFSEAIRAQLGMEPLLNQEQAGVFYQALARADQRLLLTRPYLARDGETWEPSPYWKAVVDAAGVQPLQVRPEDRRPLSEAASPAELLFWSARFQAGSQPDIPADLAGRWQAAAESRAVLAARQERAARGVYEGELASLSTVLDARFGPDSLWSPSRIENYATCPFWFFTANTLGLKLQRAPRAGLEPVHIGSLLHKLLEAAYSRCSEPANPDLVIEHLHAEAGPILEQAPREFNFRPNQLWAVEKEELLERAERAIRGLAEEDAPAGWQPFAYELKFGSTGQPPLILAEGEEIVRLHGVIDRVDRDRLGRLRVIDYKTGGSHLAPADLLKGRRLQLALYAQAVEQVLGLGEVAEGLYWVVSRSASANKNSLRLSRFTWDGAGDDLPGAGPPAAFAVSRQHAARIAGAVRAGAFQPAPPSGGCPSYCAALTWCWRYQPAEW